MGRFEPEEAEWLVREKTCTGEKAEGEHWLETGAFQCNKTDWLERDIFRAEKETQNTYWLETSAFDSIEDNWLEKPPAEGREWIVAEVEPPAATHQTTVIALPHTGEGLRKSPIRCDLALLENFLCTARRWMVLGKTLCVYSPPCWLRLDEQEAEVEIRKCLYDCGFTGPMLSSDYRELRKMLLINPDLQQKEGVTPPQFALNLMDGTLDIMTGEWRPHDPSDGFFSYLNMTLQDVSEGVSTGAFEDYVQQVARGDEDIRLQLLELAGLVVTGYSTKNFFVLLGPSHTGKSQFGRFLGELVGREFVETLRSIDDLGDRWTMGSLKGKRLVTCLDLPDEPLPPKAVGMVKQLVGDDAVKGEFKRGALFTFYEKPLLLCAGNYPVRVPNIEKEQALLNRMVVIPFGNPVGEEEERQHFYLALLEDSAYIVRCAIEAMQDLARRNFQVTRVPLPSEYTPQEGRQGLLAVKGFLESDCEIAPDNETTTQELFSCFMVSEHTAEISEVDFSRLLSQAVQHISAVRPIKRVAGTERRGYKGLQLIGKNRD